MKLNRIFVPTDFSETANLAVRQAVVLAQMYQAELVVLHARLLYDDDSSQLPEAVERLKQEEARILTKLKQSVPQSNPAVSIRHEIIRGYSAPSAILGYVNQNDFDLIVIGTHGRSGIEQLLLGSVAEKIVRYAPSPVLTVHRKSTVIESYQNIIVPFDFSEHAQRALRTAFRVSPEKGEIHLVYVFEKDTHPEMYSWNLASSIDLMPQLEIKIRQKMDAVLHTLKTGGRTVHKIIMDGTPHKKIAEYVNNAQAELVIMSTQGLVGLDRFLLGSTTERIIRSVNTQILTLKQRQLI